MLSENANRIIVWRRNTEISKCAGDIFPDIINGDDKLCILHGNILSGKYDSRVVIKFCPMCGNELKEI